jgi:hypothetical protein
MHKHNKESNAGIKVEEEAANETHTHQTFVNVWRTG